MRLMAVQDEAPKIRVALFATCLADLIRPQVALAAARLVEECGMEVHVPPQSCCGQPAYNSGEQDKTRTLAEVFVRQFEGYDYVVAPSGSCAAMVSVHYPRLFERDGESYRRCLEIGKRTWELSRFLVEVARLSPGTSADNRFEGLTIAYHDSCSGLRELGVRDQPRKLLSERCGIEIRELGNAEVCCGFGGTFCVKYPEISTRMVDNKLDGLDESGTDLLLGGDLGCLLNIAGRLRRKDSRIRVYHYAELLLNSDPGAGIGDSGGD